MKKCLCPIILFLCAVLLTGCAGPTGVTSKTEPPAPDAETPGLTEAQPEADAAYETSAAGAAEVRMTRQDGEGEKVLFEGLDGNGAVVWQRTETTGYRTELTLIEEIGAWEDRYYYTRQGSVCCLRISDGAMLWENGEFGETGISGLIDPRNGNVYLCGWYGPDFFACSRDGDTLSLAGSASGNEFFWPSGMSWDGPDRLVIYWQGGAGLEMALPYHVDLTDFSLSYDFGFESMDANRQYWADTFTLETVNELCMRFFGRTIHPANGVLYENQWGRQWVYENGRFRFPSGDGEAYNRFAVVNSRLRLPGGDVILGYDVYELDLDEYWKSGMDGALYRMTTAQAQAAEASGRITRLGFGHAEAKPIEQNGRDGYFLLRMETTLY